MTKFKNTYRIESTRLKDWDYSTPWWYYVTINTKNHHDYFGEIIDGKLILNPLGKIADLFWNEIPNHYKNAELDYYVIMPIHIHGIIIINYTAVTRHASSPQKNLTLSDIIGSFKSAVTKRIHETGYQNFSWQPRFYDRIIRNGKELYNVRNYIEQNPIKWELKRKQPENIFNL